MRPVCRGLFLLALLCPFWMDADGQVHSVATPFPGLETDALGALSRLAVRAGLIFVGSVEAIERTPTAVNVTLHVDQVIEGTPGVRYVMREWTGRWPPGVQRYVVGQRALFFLQSPSAAGFSSPVDSGDGVVPLRGDPAGGAVLDVSRLNTRLLRNVGDPLGNVSTIPWPTASQTLVETLRPGLRRPPNPSGEQPIAIVKQGAASSRVTGVTGVSR